MKSFCVIVFTLFCAALQAQPLTAANLLLCNTTHAADSVLTAHKFKYDDVSHITSLGIGYTNKEYRQKGYFPHVTVTSANNTLSYIMVELYKDSKQYNRLLQSFLSEGFAVTSTVEDENLKAKTMYSSTKHPHVRFETLVYAGKKGNHYTIALYWDTEIKPVKF